MHRARLFQAIVLILFALGGLIYRLVRNKKPEPTEADERIVLTPPIRAQLQTLRDTTKFRPDGSYPGPETPKARRRLRLAIDALIDDILGEPEGSTLDAGEVSGRLGLTIAAVAKQAPADSDRAWVYMQDIWAILGFRSGTGYEQPSPAEPERAETERADAEPAKTDR